MMQRLFVDMDGTLAVFQPITKLETLYEQGYFYDLKPNTNVVEAIRNITANQEVEVYILSSVLSDSEYALEEKNAWLDKYLPEIPRDHRIFPPCGQDKKDFIPDKIRRNDYLLDDYTTNLLLWQPPARGIKLLNGINHSSGTWRYDRIRYDKTAGIIEKDILSVMQGQQHIFDDKPEAHKQELLPYSLNLISSVPGYYDKENTFIGIANKEFLYIRFVDSDKVLFGRVLKTDPNILIVDEVNGESHYLSPGTKIVGHFDRLGRELYRDHIEDVNTDKLYTWPSTWDAHNTYFDPTNNDQAESFRTSEGMTFCYRGVPPDADKMFGMIRFYEHGALVETVYLHSQKTFDEWVEDSQGRTFSAFVNPQYRELLKFNKPCLNQAKDEKRKQPNHEDLER